MQESPVGRPEVDQLIGATDHAKADAALFVSWGGFKQGVYKELASRFFRVRLWSIRAIFSNNPSVPRGFYCIDRATPIPLLSRALIR